jgi:glycosyltransferase involved in cell wall biosynthesis
MGLQASEREPRWLTLVRNAMLVFRAERVLVISEEIGRSLAPFRLSRRRIVRCNVNGIDVAAFGTPGAGELEALRSELGVHAAHVVATIGALHPRKSHELFIRAAAIVHRTRPTVRFLIIGEGPERAALTRLIRRERLDGVIILTGSRRDVARVLALADVCVKPGVVEGFVGLTVLEAMAMRVPVVAFDTLDVRAAIHPELTGLLVPRGDVAALAGAIGRLLDEPAAARALSERAYAHVREQFGLDAVVADVERAYNDVLIGR